MFFQAGTTITGGSVLCAPPKIVVGSWERGRPARSVWRPAEHNLAEASLPARRGWFAQTARKVSGTMQTPFSLDDAFTDGAHLLRRIWSKRPIYGLEQFRLEFRVVRLQVQRLLRVQPDLLLAVSQDDNGSLMRLGNQFGQLPLGFSNGQCFHLSNLSQSLLIDKPKRSRVWRAMVQPFFCFWRLRIGLHGILHHSVILSTLLQRRRHNAGIMPMTRAFLPHLQFHGVGRGQRVKGARV